MECRDALSAALTALGICPLGLNTTVTRGSAAARRWQISQGPVAGRAHGQHDLQFTRVVLAEHAADRLLQVPFLVP